MGDPKTSRKVWRKPKRPLNYDLIMDELKTLGTFGLKTKRELWKTQTELSRVRLQARSLLALRQEDREKKEPLYFVNPEKVYTSEDQATYEEGCLSVPGQFAEIDRPDKCHIKYLDYNGDSKELKAEGLLATCIQHEIDHLEGILFIDYLSKLKRSMITKKLSKQKKELERIVV